MEGSCLGTDISNTSANCYHENCKPKCKCSSFRSSHLIVTAKFPPFWGHLQLDHPVTSENIKCYMLGRDPNSPGREPSGRIFWVSKIKGVRGRQSDLDDMAVMGYLFTIAATWDIMLTSSSWVSFRPLISNSMASRVRRIVPIWPSHTPPKWDAWGGLNCQAHPLLDRYLSTDEWFIWVRASSSSVFAPMKLPPRSHLSLEAGPRIEKNLLRAHVKELTSIDSSCSMWISQASEDKCPAQSPLCLGLVCHPLLQY